MTERMGEWWMERDELDVSDKKMKESIFQCEAELILILCLVT